MCSFVCEQEGTLAPAISSGWKVFKGLLHHKFLFETWLCQMLKSWISGNAFRDFKGVKERKQIYPPKQQILNKYFCEEILHRWPWANQPSFLVWTLLLALFRVTTPGIINSRVNTRFSFSASVSVLLSCQCLLNSCCVQLARILMPARIFIFHNYKSQLNCSVSRINCQVKYWCSRWQKEIIFHRPLFC